MKESKVIGRRLFRAPRLALEELTMPVDLHETRLPGVGSKFTLRLDAGGRLAIILHNDGKRELYFFRAAATTSRARSSRSTTTRRASSAR